MGGIANTTQTLNSQRNDSEPLARITFQWLLAIRKLLVSNNMYQATDISTSVQSSLCECSQNNKDYRLGGVFKTGIYKYYF